MKIRTFSSYSLYYKEFLEEVFKNNKDMSDLIIDLRGNYGGSLYNVWELFKYLIDKKLELWSVYYASTITIKGEKVKRFKIKHSINDKIIPAEDNFKGKVWLLTDRSLASSAPVATYFFKKLNLGKIIDEKPMKPVNTLAIVKPYVLPNTGLMVKVPNVSYWFEKEPEIIIDYERKIMEEERIEWLLGKKMCFWNMLLKL